MRAGITDRFELRFGFNYEAGSGGSVVTPIETGEGLREDEFSTEASLMYGCKALITEQEGWLPRSVGIIEAFTPTAGEVWGTEPAATYAFGWELSEGRRFDAAIRYVYADSEEGTFDKWIPSVVLRWPVTERFEVHGEWFGTWTRGLEDDTVRPFLGPAGHYVIVPGLEIGVRVGWGLTRARANGTNREASIRGGSLAQVAPVRRRPAVVPRGDDLVHQTLAEVPLADLSFFNAFLEKAVTSHGHRERVSPPVGSGRRRVTDRRPARPPPSGTRRRSPS